MADRMSVRMEAQAYKRWLRTAPPKVRAFALSAVRDSTIKHWRLTHAGFNTAGTIAPLHHGGLGMVSRSGRTRRWFDYRINRTKMVGVTGILSASRRRFAPQARFFLFGTRRQAARPVHVRARRVVYPEFVRDNQAVVARVLRGLR